MTRFEVRPVVYCSLAKLFLLFLRRLLSDSHLLSLRLLLPLLLVPPALPYYIRNADMHSNIRLQFQ